MSHEPTPSATERTIREPGTDINDEGIRVPVGTGVQVLNLEGEFLWSISPERDGHRQGDSILVPWPRVLRPHLNGSARLSLTDVSGEVAIFDDVVTLGNGEGVFEVLDKYGYPVSVDKVGHLQRSFAATNQQIKDEILSGTVRVLDELRDVVGVDAYLNYGALLGAVRDGTMIAHDSDTDLCYVSKYDQPADIILESFRMERTLRQRGWKVLRMSAGDIKVMLQLSDGRQCHIDVFGAFWINDVFYQFGNRSGHLPRESLLPLGTIELDGYTFPAPRVPEDMMAFLYGENWRIPDPSFAYADPEPGKRRLNGWFRGFRSVMGLWGEFHNGIGAGADAKVRPNPSEFAEWVHAELGDQPDAKIADVCSGAGRDAVWWSEQGRSVRAYDYSLAGRRTAKELARVADVDIHLEMLIIGELRTLFKVGAELARDPHHMTSRLGLNALEDPERLNLWRLAKLALRGHGGQLFLEFSAHLDGRLDLTPPDPRSLLRRIDPRIVRTEIEAAGGRVEFEEIVEGFDLLEARDPAMCRMRVTFPAPGHRPLDEN